MLLSNWQHSGDDCLSYRSSNGTKLRRRRHRRSASDSSDLNTFGSELSEDENDHSENSHQQVNKKYINTQLHILNAVLIVS